MLGLNEVMRGTASYYEGLTGGGNGLSLPDALREPAHLLRMGLVAAS